MPRRGYLFVVKENKKHIAPSGNVIKLRKSEGLECE